MVCLPQTVNVIHAPMSKVAIPLVSFQKRHGSFLVLQAEHTTSTCQKSCFAHVAKTPQHSQTTVATAVNPLRSFCHFGLVQHTKQREKQSVNRRRRAFRRSGIWNRLLDLLISTHAAVMTATIRSRREKTLCIVHLGPAVIRPCLELVSVVMHSSDRCVLDTLSGR